MQGYLYILQSEKTQKYYIGSTIDLTKRLTQHNQGQTKSLKQHIPLTLKFKQQFDTITQARQIEYKLKKKKNKQIIEAIIRDQEIKMGR